MSEHKEIGQVCYEAYANARQWKDGNGYDLWSWPGMSEHDKDAWRAAAQEVMRKGWGNPPSPPPLPPPPVTPPRTRPKRGNEELGKLVRNDPYGPTRTYIR